MKIKYFLFWDYTGCWGIASVCYYFYLLRRVVGQSSRHAQLLRGILSHLPNYEPSPSAGLIGWVAFTGKVSLIHSLPELSVLLCSFSDCVSLSFTVKIPCTIILLMSVCISFFYFVFVSKKHVEIISLLIKYKHTELKTNNIYLCHCDI